MICTILGIAHFLISILFPSAVTSSDSCSIDSDITMAGTNERTFIMIKPDGVQRGLVGDIIKRFEQKGFKLVALKLMQVIITKGCSRVCPREGLEPPQSN